MKSEFCRINGEIAREIKRISHTLKIPATEASVIVFYGLNANKSWNDSMDKVRIHFWRGELKKRIAMTL